MKTGGIVIAFLLLFLQLAKAQQKPVVSPEYQAFMQDLNRSGISFVFPDGFKEIKVPDDENLTFDYGLQLNNKDFEVWYIINNLKSEWVSYNLSKDDPEKVHENPDSLYIGICSAQALALAGKGNYFMRNLPDQLIEKQFNADVGKSYLLNLYDTPVLKHYQYALLLMLQKNGRANLLMLFLSNDNGPEFYKNVNMAYRSIRFK